MNRKILSAIYIATLLILVAVFLSSHCRADVQWITPKKLYEIRDNPETGFFQHVISAAVSENDGALYILAGPPDGIYIYHNDNGAPWKQFQLDDPADPGDRVSPCGSRIWYVHKQQLYEISEKGELVQPKISPAPLPGEISEIYCDQMDRLLVVDGARSEIRRYDSKGKMELRIGPPEKCADQQQQPAPAPAAPFKTVRDIAIDAFNRFYVLDSRARAILMFNQKGDPMNPISDDQFADVPFPYDSPSVAIDTDRYIWVVNPQENTLDAYSNFGSLTKRMGRNVANSADFVFPFSSPVSIFIDDFDRLYVIDSADTTLKVFDLKN